MIPTPPEASFEEAFANFQNAVTDLIRERGRNGTAESLETACANARTAHAREVAAASRKDCRVEHEECPACARIIEQKVAAARADNADHDWRKQMEAHGFDSVEAVLKRVAAARAETWREIVTYCDQTQYDPVGNKMLRRDEDSWNQAKRATQKYALRRAAAAEKESHIGRTLDEVIAEKYPDGIPKVEDDDAS